MPDVFDQNKRSEIMSKIKSKNTSIELVVRSYLHRNGFRYRLHKKSLPGSPDIVLRKYNTVIFVNGCFWHQHGCKFSKLPKSNTEYWTPKLKLNVERDNESREKLEDLGWNVIVIWECEVNNNFDSLMLEVVRELKSHLTKDTE